MADFDPGIRMRRRAFLAVLGGALTFPLAAPAQPRDRVRRVGILIGIAESEQAQLRIAAVRDGLKERGWTDNIRFDIRMSGGDGERLRAQAAELLALNPDVIFAGNGAALAAAHAETRTVPIVFAQVADPVANGFVASLARPGGNATGFTNFEEQIAGKWLELLKQIAPNVDHAGLIYDPANVTGSRFLATVKAAAASLGIETAGYAVHEPPSMDRAIDAIAERPNGGLIVVGGPGTASHRDHIIALAARRQLPAVYPYRYFVASGGLASYGIDTIDLYRRAASYVDRVLRGEKPAELPVQQPTKLEMTINLKTAKALGLQVAPTLLTLADEVIE